MNKNTIINLFFYTHREREEIPLIKASNPIYFNNNTYSKLLFNITPINKTNVYIRTYREIPIKIYNVKSRELKDINSDSLIWINEINNIKITAIVNEVNSSFDFFFGSERERANNIKLKKDFSLIKEDVIYEKIINCKRNRKINNKCNICLEFTPEDNKAILNKCKHKFCYPCILKWSKLSSECPICKENFNSIEYDNIKKRGKKDKKKTKNIKNIKKKKYKYSDDSDDQLNDDIVEKASDFCIVCGRGDNKDVLLICDMCQFNVCHTYCDNLDKIPDGYWFCKKCKRKLKHRKWKNLCKLE